MENYWKIQFPQRLVANLLGETSDPFLFYGNTIEDQNSRIDQMEKEGETDAVQFMHLLILFNSILFHNHDLSKSCLRKIVKNKAVSIWKPWLIFFQCFTDILSLPNVEKKAERKKLKEAIDKQRDLLLGKNYVIAGQPFCDDLQCTKKTTVVHCNCTKRLVQSRCHQLQRNGLFDRC